MGNEDPWQAPDKLYHILFCLSLTLIFSTLAAHTRYPFICRHSVRLGSILSLAAEAAKEAADHIGFFHSYGASPRDAIVDVVGVLIASFALSLRNYKAPPGHDRDSDPVRGILLV